MNKTRLFLWMVILALLAGVINAIAVLGYDGMTVSHITGLVSKFSISVATGEWKGCLDLLAVIIAFFAGAVVAGIASGERSFYLHRVYGFIILAIGALIPCALILDARHSVLLFALLMSLQNGMVVSYRGVVVRMTHMTGNLTDLGVYIGYKIRGNKNEAAVTGLVPGTILLGFTVGGIAGILLFMWIRNAVFIVVSAVYIVLGFVYFYLQKTCVDKDFNDVPDSLEQ